MYSSNYKLDPLLNKNRTSTFLIVDTAFVTVLQPVDTLCIPHCPKLVERSCAQVIVFFRGFVTLDGDDGPTWPPLDWWLRKRPLTDPK